MDHWIEILSLIGKGILLINLAVYCIGFSGGGKAYTYFISYLAWILLCEIVFYVLNSQKINNLFFSHYYLIGQFLLLGLFFHEIVTEKYQKKTARTLLIIIPVVLVIQYIIYPEKYYVFNLFEIFVTSYSIIILALFHLYNILDTQKKYNYISLGLLLYLISSTVIFLSGNLYTVMNRKLHKEIWVFNVVMFIVYQIFILIDYLSSRKKNV
ncbi:MULTISPECIES: hypothetical protein [Chryseobacterium]|uniref:YhhN-like protein n=1 Tax=Chryseobacterium cucumeris TaxID=1813611 RepID=A0ABX9XDW1_9FLAO|nr:MULTISPECIES: hypothetical protein [Chryseobacterium]KYH07033.1 hypothetical protein A1704_21510 [Chryseobacterium cucumeris]MDH5032687.1 hypothetical protein [Chryseobacterium cucumeris]QWT86340.1 hypothetical protein KBP46_00185 [Chryseobacterium sp. PCH239]RKE82229.1 hypothetical protein DEU39_1783 [Chryseobacterium sp. AG363]ROH96574.1 hypothetical protein EGI15_01900 [Chryseobacterium cucumeris]